MFNEKEWKLIVKLLLDYSKETTNKKEKELIEKTMKKLFDMDGISLKLLQ